MRQQVIGNRDALRSQLVDGSGEIDRVPMDNRRRDQAQPRGAEALVFECAVADFAEVEMKAYHIDRFGSIGGIVRRSTEEPRSGPNEVLMRVRASSLNYRDLMVLKGGGRGPTKPGVIPLSDGAGEIEAVGEGVTRVKGGDRIAGCFHPRWYGGPIKPEYLTDRLGANLDGMLAEYAVLSEEAFVQVPNHLSF